jgi:hypothetical protein
VGAHLVRHYRQLAPAQEIILDSFQELGWPTCLDDPLPPKANVVVRQRLSDTLKNINREQQGPYVFFWTLEDGEAATWRICFARMSARDGRKPGLTTTASPAERRVLASRLKVDRKLAT